MVHHFGLQFRQVNHGKRRAKRVVAGSISIHGDTRRDQGKSTCRFIRLAYRASNEKQPEDSSNISVHLVSRVISLFYRQFTIAFTGTNFECAPSYSHSPRDFKRPIRPLSHTATVSCAFHGIVANIFYETSVRWRD